MGDLKKIKRQAVVIIHGIGEQRPMTTLRGFVSSLLNFESNKFSDDHDFDKNERVFWTKPDKINNSYELRKITAKEVDVRPTTHFFEYHWAGNMRDTKWKHVSPWILSLMFSNPLRFKNWRIHIIWVLMWLFSVSWCVYAGFLFYQFCCLGENPFKEGGLIKALILGIPLFLYLSKNIFLGFVGDAARYFRVSVDNIAQREAIRKNGVKLIRALHKTEDYDRIILVGHSLGSVIAYDILSYLWIEFYKSLNLQKEDKKDKDYDWGHSFDMLKHDDETLREIDNQAVRAEEGNKVDEDYFQENQHKLWHKIQDKNKSWLISDLITMGSPLTHANILMADDEADFNMRTEEREYPKCPPTLDEKSESILFSYGKDEQHKYYLHHATPFCCTRWTNIYYPGDIVGGGLRKNFGPGIKDIEVTYASSMLNRIRSFLSPLTHVSYWKNNSDPETIAKSKEYLSIKTLYEALEIRKKEADQNGS